VAIVLLVEQLTYDHNFKGSKIKQLLLVQVEKCQKEMLHNM
jgi:hypothetical protein